MKNRYWSYLDTSNAMVRWNVATGIITPPHLMEKDIPLPSQFLRSRLVKGKNELELEYELERIRQNKFPEKISRLNCLFVFEDEQDAITAGSTLQVKHFQGVCLSEVEAINQYNFSKHDSNWITYFFKNGSNFPENWMDLYWSGSVFSNPKPLWEILVNGRMLIMNQEMRQECYDRFEKDLKCTFLIKLSIMAPIANSDLGKICSFLKKRGSCNIFTNIIKFEENEAIRIFGIIKETHPEQVSAIKPYDQNTLCILPDFTDLDYCLTHKCNPSNCPNSH